MGTPQGQGWGQGHQGVGDKDGNTRRSGMGTELDPGVLGTGMGTPRGQGWRHWGAWDGDRDIRVLVTGMVSLDRLG